MPKMGRARVTGSLHQTSTEKWNPRVKVSIGGRDVSIDTEKKGWSKKREGECSGIGTEGGCGHILKISDRGRVLRGKIWERKGMRL